MNDPAMDKLEAERTILINILRCPDVVIDSLRFAYWQYDLVGLDEDGRKQISLAIRLLMDYKERKLPK